MTEQVKTPEEFEKELLQKAQDSSEDVMEMAAKTYHIQLQRFKALKHLLKSGRSKMRLLDLILEYPLNDAKLKAHTEVERELALLCDQILQAKFLLLFANYQQHAEKLLEAQNSLTEEVKDDTVIVTGESNG